MPELDPARRAVVTGLGAVMPIGNDFPTYWSNLVAGVTGTRTIQSFDPTTVMEPKMARRMSRFIHLAMGAGKEAVADSGIDFAAMRTSCCDASKLLMVRVPVTAAWRLAQ